MTRIERTILGIDPGPVSYTHLVVAQSVSLGVLLTAPAPDGLPPVAARHSVTTDGVSEVSSNGNIIMFVLDTYDTLFLEEGLEEEPGCLDEFTGFTWFDNSTGSMIPCLLYTSRCV